MKNFKTIFTLLSLVSWIIISLVAQAPISILSNESGISASALQKYENFLQTEIDAGRIPGAISMVHRKGHTAHFKALGYNNMNLKDPMTTDKIFYVQSMTKPIISVAFMTLYEQGHFFLTDPVSKYLPEFNDLKVMKLNYDDQGQMTGVDYVPLESPILIWHLLSHTAGFSHGLGDNDYDTGLRKALYETPHATIKDRVKALTSYPLMGQPGKQWNYSAAPDVLALLIEHFSGMTADAYLQKTIFDPLDMHDTGYNVSDANLSRVVGLHQVQPDGSLISADQWSPAQGNTVYGGTHGIFSTAEDYMKFAVMLLNNGKYNDQHILGRKTLELMTENHIEGLPYSPGNGFGLGFGVRTDLSDSKISGSEGIFHWSGAFNTYFLVDQKEEMVAILMTQFWPYTNHYASKMRQLVYSAIED